MRELVSNTSPLIVLAKAGLLEVLPKICARVFVPRAVRDEIMAGPESDAMKQMFSHCGWLRVTMLEPPLSPLAAMQLGLGEAEAIELARRKPGCAVLLDDRAGRRAARALGLPTSGTLSVVAIASQHGHIKSFDDAVGRLRSAGYTRRMQWWRRCAEEWKACLAIFNVEFRKWRSKVLDA
jgi:uncharacterized protein